jgi:1-aminocyclopropane-1-carboxylate deaminase
MCIAALASLGTGAARIAPGTARGVNSMAWCAAEVAAPAPGKRRRVRSGDAAQAHMVPTPRARGAHRARWEPQVERRVQELRDGARGRVSDMMRDVHSPLQPLRDPILEECGVELTLKRDDLIHPDVSGNKWRKLKYNLVSAAATGTSILTLGGAFSNHIAATAAVAAMCGVKTVGIIRGEELAQQPLNPTLHAAQAHGMHLEFVTRQQYRTLTSAAVADAQARAQDFENCDDARPPPDVFWKLFSRYGPFQILPEGGSNLLGVYGCSEILAEDAESSDFDFVTVAAGTGATLAGLAIGASEGQQVIGFPVLKGGAFTQESARGFVQQALGVDASHESVQRVGVYLDAHHGGYGKVNGKLISFMRQFYRTTGVKLDPIYTGKLVMAIYDMAKKGLLHELRQSDNCLPPGEAVKRGRGPPRTIKVLAVHTGGLQGIAGVELRLGEKIFPD